MRASVDRVSGLSVAALGALLLLVVIPAEIETVEYGWVQPATLPTALACVLIGLGLVQAAVPARPSELAGGPALRAYGYLALAVLAAWAMDRLGFGWVAPVFVLAVMGLIGERRPLWLALGAGMVPAAIWGAVSLLGRPLPG